MILNHFKTLFAGAGRLSTAGLFSVLSFFLALVCWGYLEHPVSAPDWDGHFEGVTYSGYRPGEGPHTGKYPTEAEIRQDFQQLSQYTSHIRTYSASEGPVIGPIAQEFGMTVMAGSWVQGDKEADEKELKALIAEAKSSKAVKQLLVGNESLLRGDLTVEQLSRYLDRVRKATKKPVSTTEPWNIWLENPELAKHVDFIAVHILPVWEKQPIENAVDFTFARLADLQRKFPKKRIVLAETGWPSGGEANGAAVPSAKNQSLYLREFAERAKAQHTNYFVFTFADEAWKRAEEGRVGMYWGIVGADRHLKLSATGSLWDDHGFAKWAPTALLWAALPVFAFCFVFAHLTFATKLSFSTALYGAAGYLAWYSRVYDGLYDVSPATMHWVLEPLTVLCLAVLLVQLFEVSNVLGARKLKREFGLAPLAADRQEPAVSIHLACANEPPEMVIATLESLKAMQYRNFEVLVVDNNTKDENLWAPVKDWVDANPEHFKFWHLPKCPGFKAEALNHALQNTRSDAAVVGVIDADYIVEPDWLSSLMGHFDESNVALVQSPQAHRDFEDSRLGRWAAYEFDGFFRIGMHSRNTVKRGAIIQHGTMCLVRAHALIQVGGWAQWTICEDAELGLRLMEAGYETRYVDHVMGRGLPPATFASFRSQRRRWALGAMQIMKGHARQLFWPSKLTFAQRYHFIAGWLPWMSEALQLAGTTLSIAWTAAMLVAPTVIAPPIAAMLTLVFSVPVIRFVMGVGAFRIRVGTNWRDTFGAALAAMSVIYATAEGVLAGLLGKHAKFIVTAKGKSAGSGNMFAAVKRELWLTGLLWLGAVLTFLSYERGHTEPEAWSAALMVLSLPYVATLLTVWLTDERKKPAESGAKLEQWAHTKVTGLLARDSVSFRRRNRERA
ncbi:glycosyltransferase family 2 protein [Burkholderia cenocepacia]|uniref:glycosyltransferase family 2 protein n=1 Tax=Burkholderia cenocepacia TaxID=95486 RepID=UPI00076CB2B3|nr:glycosyltransferase family 2 protein [Burkholderia cenocepacia]KWU17929.1 hypothetical protein AS149_14745 [Burkholderia cenocepacia]